MPNNSSEHHVPFNLFLFVVVILCISFIMIVLDYSAVPLGQQPTLEQEEVMMPGRKATAQTPQKLTAQQYGDTVYYAYKPSESMGMIISNNEVFLIGRSLDDTKVISNFPGWTTTTWLFDFVGDEMYVVNTQNNAIDVFSIVDEGVYYSRSLLLPPYETGVLYGISCEDETTCEVNTALHLEAGCNLTLDVASETFSEPLCGGGYGEYFGTYVPDFKAL